MDLDHLKDEKNIIWNVKSEFWVFSELDTASCPVSHTKSYTYNCPEVQVYPHFYSPIKPANSCSWAQPANLGTILGAKSPLEIVCVSKGWFQKKYKENGWIYPSGLAGWGQQGAKIQPK